VRLAREALHDRERRDTRRYRVDVHWAVIDTAFFAGVVEWLGSLARYR